MKFEFRIILQPTYLNFSDNFIFHQFKIGILSDITSTLENMLKINLI